MVQGAIRGEVVPLDEDEVADDPSGRPPFFIDFE